MQNQVHYISYLAYHDLPNYITNDKKTLKIIQNQVYYISNDKPNCISNDKGTLKIMQNQVHYISYLT